MLSKGFIPLPFKSLLTVTEDEIVHSVPGRHNDTPVSEDFYVFISSPVFFLEPQIWIVHCLLTSPINFSPQFLKL